MPTCGTDGSHVHSIVTIIVWVNSVVYITYCIFRALYIEAWIWGVYVYLSNQFIYSTCTEVMSDLYHHVNPTTRCHSPIISREVFDLILQNAEVNLCSY